MDSRMAPPGSCRALLVLLALASSGSPLPAVGGEARGFPFEKSAGERPYSLQMHIHAHSNHNASSHPASLQWHVAQAAKSGTDFIWWSEHPIVFEMLDTVRIAPAEGSFDPNGLDVRFLPSADAGKTELIQNRISLIRAHTHGGRAGAEFLDGYLVARLRARSGPEKSARITYRPESLRGRIHTVSWARPLAGGLYAEADIDWSPTGPRVRAFFEFLLSWHYYKEPIQYRIRYELVPETEPAGMEAMDPGSVLVRVPCAGGRSRVGFDLAAAGRLLCDGDDATLELVEWGIEAEEGDSASLGLKTLDIFSKKHDRESYHAAVRGIMKRYREEYGVSQAIGVEVAFPAVHLSGFCPDSMLVPGSVERGSRGGEPEEWVSQVHEREGIVSYNHPFGTLMGLDRGRAETDFASIIEEKGLAMMGSRAHGADILEVGYVERNLPLQAHLALWDFLTSHGLFLYGNGTSDSHGGLWFQESKNWFHTWVWASEPTPDALIRGMRSGRMFFGDISLWDGEFDFRVGPYRSGDRVPWKEDTLDLRVLLDPLPEGAIVGMFQGRIGAKGSSVEYDHWGTRIDVDRMTQVRIDGPCFVRLEVWQATAPDAPEIPLLFSNPIVFYQP